jgi:hypothetical protein
MRPLVLSLLLVCFCLTLNAQTSPKNDPSPSGPSLQDTAQWIASKLVLTGYDNTNVASRSVYTALSAKIDSCVLTYSAHSSSSNNTNHREFGWDETHTFHLGAIGSVSAFQTTSTYDVVAALTSQADAVTYTNVYGYPTLLIMPPARTNVAFPFGLANGQDNNDLSTRMQKALTHVAELCAASYKDRNGKEPF